MRIAFCDVDGVLRHSAQIARDASEPNVDELMDVNCVTLLNRLMAESRKVEQTELVLSATIRLEHKLIELNNIFSRSGLNCGILDVTPYGPPTNWSWRTRRAGEIHTWLVDHPSVTSFVILDDEISDMEPLLPWTVHVKDGYFKRGLKGYHVRRALEILNSPLGTSYAQAYSEGFPRRPPPLKE